MDRVMDIFSSGTRGRPIEILLVEDNPADVRLTVEALKEAKVCNTLHVAGDGQEALDVLHRRGTHAGATRPDVVFLDLNLPRRTGQDVLAEIKQDPDLKTIPVVVLTSSSAEEDIMKSYESHANCYVTKPVDFTQFMKVVSTISDFWFSIVRLPSET